MHVFLNFDILFMEMSMKRKMCFSPFSPKIIFELDLFLIKQGMFFVLEAKQCQILILVTDDKGLYEWFDFDFFLL